MTVLVIEPVTAGATVLMVTVVVACAARLPPVQVSTLLGSTLHVAKAGAIALSNTTPAGSGSRSISMLAPATWVVDSMPELPITNV